MAGRHGLSGNIGGPYGGTTLRSHRRGSRQSCRARTPQPQSPQPGTGRPSFISRRSALPASPYLFPGTNNMWVNVGKSQIHMPSGEPKVLRGHIGLVVPDLEELFTARRGQEKARRHQVRLKQHNDYVVATCPWGNEFRVYEPDVERFGAIDLGLGFVEFPVPEKTADGIARFYREIVMLRPGHGERPRQGGSYLRRGQPGANLPRDRPANAGIRRPSLAGLCRGFSGPHESWKSST